MEDSVKKAIEHKLLDQLQLQNCLMASTAIYPIEGTETYWIYYRFSAGFHSYPFVEYGIIAVSGDDIFGQHNIWCGDPDKKVYFESARMVDKKIEVQMTGKPQGVALIEATLGRDYGAPVLVPPQTCKFSVRWPS